MKKCAEISINQPAILLAQHLHCKSPNMEMSTCCTQMTVRRLWPNINQPEPAICMQYEKEKTSNIQNQTYG